jgi:hypothetical protein
MKKFHPFHYSIKLFPIALSGAAVMGFAASLAAQPPSPHTVKPGAPKSGASHFTALKVEPTTLTFGHAGDLRRVVVRGRTPNGEWIDATRTARFTPAAGTVRVEAEGGFAPVKAGTDRVTIAAGGQQAALPVTVASTRTPPVSFVRDVMPILSKAGCNAGTCHGAQKGKGGFKLSLRGYDPEWDHYVFTTELSGRRINRSDPAQSLVLLKPSQGVPHKGGFVLDPKSDYYQTLLRWVNEGVKFDGAKVKRADRLTILPDAPELQTPGEQQQVLVLAHYPDGSTRDVTADAVYTSAVPEVATVTPTGLVTAVRRGEAPILVRYEGVYGTDTLTVMGDRRGWKWAEEPANGPIDTLVYRKLQKVKGLPSPLCTDAEFLRRVSLDLTGLPPAPEKVRAFLADKTPAREKRDRLVDQLLDSPEYVDHWTNKWADLLDVNRKFIGEKGVWVFRDWIHRSVSEDKPYDRFVREILTAKGDAWESAPANYYRINREPNRATENTTQLFLGVRFSCNKCHDHPFERWTQNQYYQMAAFFGQVGLKPASSPEDEIVFDNASAAPVLHPKTLKPVSAKVPVGDVTASGAASKRQKMAAWLTSPDNPYFARSMANRVWSYFFGKGIIDPVDDIRAGNPPSNPALLSYLTKRFVESGFRTKALVREIVRSRAYQRSIVTNRWNADDTINFSHAVPRRLTAEQLLDSVAVATGRPLKFPGLPEGFHATQLPDAGVPEGEFLDLFGRPPRDTPCECERASTVSLGQALNLVNGPTIADALADPNNRLARLAKQPSPPKKKVEEIYLAALSRPPTPQETAKASRIFEEEKNAAEAGQDLMWALINSPAFLFNR